MGVFIVMTALGFGAMALSGNPLYLVVGVVLGTILGLSKRKDGKP